MNTEEFTGRYHDAWLSKRFTLPLRHVKRESPLILHCRRLPYPEKLTISIYVNGKLIHEEKNPGGKFTISTSIPAMLRGNLEIIASDVFVPKEKKINDDVRKLSFLVDELIVPGLPDLMEPYIHLLDFKPSRKVYFLDDEVWDQLSFLLPSHYKVPNKKMAGPLKDREWWEKIRPEPVLFISGRVYDKFSGVPLPKAVVHVVDEKKNQILKTVTDRQGAFHFSKLKPGRFVVKAQADRYGLQEINVGIGEFGKIVHMPMLPLV
ncbi:carboxypeptidase-like regulatory domain-containing protein [Brevibacillus borstelensis]|uniref:carboxypeptidase-like regulatory domain-containing protein n=1 Tax=Brevibacillus borstelensis TaxID=45462 RepID=UPI0030C376D6